jgi:DNA-directed RNA polymerase subunit RPC12/RpoP
MYEALRATGWERGKWIPWVHPVFPGPVFKDTVALACPTCGRAFCLADHVIGPDGAVSPSVVCPYNCGFHVFMKIVQ